MAHYIELQHETLELLEAPPAHEPATTPAVKVMILPSPDTDHVMATLSHHDAAVLASHLADDLALATWEDAEWH